MLQVAWDITTGGGCGRYLGCVAGSEYIRVENATETRTLGSKGSSRCEHVTPPHVGSGLNFKPHGRFLTLLHPWHRVTCILRNPPDALPDLILSSSCAINPRFGSDTRRRFGPDLVRDLKVKCNLPPSRLSSHLTESRDAVRTPTEASPTQHHHPTPEPHENESSHHRTYRSQREFRHPAAPHRPSSWNPRSLTVTQHV